MAANTKFMDMMAYNLRLTDVAEEPRKLLLPIEGYEKLPLVTLEEAIEPIAGIIPKIRPKVYIAKNNCEQPRGGLTSDMAAAIMLYTMGKSSDEQPFYYILNSILRSDQLDRCDKLKSWFLYLKLFITALSYIPSYRGTVYRGVKLDLSEYYTHGKKFVWWGFSSCTKSLGVLQSELFLWQQGMGTLFVIECFSGKEICQYSHYENEDEVLLVAARQFVVVSRLNPKPHLWIIQVKEIEPPFPFLKTDSSISSTFEMSLISAPANICSQCSKTMTIVSTLNAETTTDDLPCNVKSDKETLSDDLDTTNKSEIMENSSSSSLPSDLINSVASVTTTNNEQIQENIVSLSNTDFFSMHGATNLNTIMTKQSVTQNTQKKVMSFKNELITIESAKIMAENIHQNVALEILYFFNNSLNNIALYHIIQAIVNRSCLKVFINDNKITDVGATYIADVLSGAPNAISQLRLEKNQITAQGVKSIIQALLRTPNSGLRTLSFTGNSLINDECIDDIIHLLNENRTLKSLYLEKCSLSEDGKTRLRMAISKRETIFLQI
jgi:hypothetical protein